MDNIVSFKLLFFCKNTSFFFLQLKNSLINTRRFMQRNITKDGEKKIQC